MDMDTPSGGSKRTRRTTELSDDGIPLSARRKVSRISYNESNDDEEDHNGELTRGSDALLDEVEAKDDPDIIRCVCGDNGPDKKRAFIGCDGCGIWQHMDCVGLSGYEEEAPDKYLCERCGPYGKMGAGFGGSPQSALPIRSIRQNGTPSKQGPARKQTLSELTQSYYKGALSVKKSRKRVSFSSDVKPASSSSGEGDAYNPSNEAISDDEEEDYAGDLSEEDSEDIRLPQSHRSHRSEDEDEDISLAIANSTENSTPKKSTHPPGTSEISQDIIKKWMEGEYAAEFASELNGANGDSDAGSDVSEIEIPDMSEGDDLLVKLMEQEQVIFCAEGEVGEAGGEDSGAEGAGEGVGGGGG